MSDVVDIRPEISATRDITPHWVDCRIDELLRECDLIGVPIALALISDATPHIRMNHTATEEAAYTLCGVLDDVKDVLRGAGSFELVPVEDGDEDKGS